MSNSFLSRQPYLNLKRLFCIRSSTTTGVIALAFVLLLFALYHLFYASRLLSSPVHFASHIRPNIVYIHLGPSLPNYLNISIAQTRLFNPDANIFILANSSAFNLKKRELSPYNVTLVDALALVPSDLRTRFNNVSNLDRSDLSGFWFFTTARFFFLSEMMASMQLTNVIHMECDIMVYCQFSKLIGAFVSNYQTLGATFDSDSRVIPGFVWVRNHTALDSYLSYLVETPDQHGKNDMVTMANFRLHPGNSHKIKPLPIMPPKYVELHKGVVTAFNGAVGANANEYVSHFDEFGNSIFDAAALGQYLGGIDPRNDFGNIHLGFVNEGSILNPSKLWFQWITDDHGRLILVATERNIENSKESIRRNRRQKSSMFRINTLHCHSKDLMKFYSLRKSNLIAYNAPKVATSSM